MGRICDDALERAGRAFMVPISRLQGVITKLDFIECPAAIR